MEIVNFSEMNLNEELQRAIEDMGFEKASPIQAKAIPVALEKKDIIGQAQTGTGKTASFGIPLLSKIDPNNKKLQAVVLCPTRELAMQVCDEMRKLAKYMHGVKILPVYGGQDIVRQIKMLKAGTQVVIGTPGRVMDHMRRKTVKFGNVETLVLDEADEMLNMGFREDIETIIEALPEERQTLLFSATMPKAILDIAKTYQKSPEIIKVIKKELTVQRIKQYYYEVKNENKQEAISRLLDVYNPKLSLVFCNTKKQVDELVEGLKNRGYYAEGLHGDLKQIQRDRVMHGFRNGSTQILVATDVAARGIDVDDVEAVFNYDVPQDDEYYVHRIGRTGRAGREGVAFTLISGRDIYKLKEIMKYCKTTIELKKIPTNSDVLGIKVQKVLENVDNTIENDDLTKILSSIEDKMEESDYSKNQMVAALLKLMLGEQSASKEDINYSTKYYDKKDSNSRKQMVRLFINVGKQQKIRPGDILGAIAGETGLPGKVVGSIDMYDKYTFVDVPGKYVRNIMDSMKHAKIKGKNVNIETANRNGGKSSNRSSNSKASNSKSSTRQRRNKSDNKLVSKK